MDNIIKVVELFAGVGGFRLGLEGWQNTSPSSGYTEFYESPYRVVWSNQWEPSTKTQHASMVYENRWGSNGHSNEDIASVDVATIPDHDLLVGGFPCQDYSVATTLRNSKGLIGKKGVLWWSIQKILNEKQNKPKYLILENVDRILISPAAQRGRDFAIILQSLNELGYAVEWRIINAAEYGMPQRRRRAFILAYHSTSAIYNSLNVSDAAEWILEDGTLANAFPSVLDGGSRPSEFELQGNIVEISENFNRDKITGTFQNSGVMINGLVTTFKTNPNYDGPFTHLRDIIQNGEVPAEFYINGDDFDRWAYLKGAKRELRKKADGFEYFYTEGGMVFPDSLDRPSRTIITGEGGPSPSRFKHVILTPRGHRRLSPVELERLNMFPDNHTQLERVTDTKRAFFMGNALVVGVVEKIGVSLKEKIQNGVTVQS